MNNYKTLLGMPKIPDFEVDMDLLKQQYDIADKIENILWL